MILYTSELIFPAVEQPVKAYSNIRRYYSAQEDTVDLNIDDQKCGIIQWLGELYDGTSTRTGPLQSQKLKIELKDNAKMNKKYFIL